MRKMFSENQIKKIAEEAGGGVKPEDVIEIVNDAISDGDIDVLVLPESAPAAQQLVGVNTSGVQNALSIGEGLMIENNILKDNILYIDWNKQQPSATITLDEATYQKITSYQYRYIRLINIYTQGDGSLLFRLATMDWTPGNAPYPTATFKHGANQYILVPENIPYFDSHKSLEWWDLGLQCGIPYIAPNWDNFVVLSTLANNQIKLSNGTGSSNNTQIMSFTSQALSISGGTLSSGKYPTSAQLVYIQSRPRALNNFSYSIVDSDIDSGSFILMRVTRLDVTNNMLYIFGQYINDITGTVTASYTGTINCTNGVYTITKHSA